MRNWLSDRPTLRGFLIIIGIVVVVMALNLYVALFTVAAILRIAFFLAIAFFVFLMWRERRDEISEWNTRSRVVFYGAALAIVVAVGAYVLHGAFGLDALAFVLVLGLCGFAMWRVWRDRHTYL